MKAVIKKTFPRIVDTVGFLVLAVVAFFMVSSKDPSVIWQFCDFIELSDEHGKVMAGFVLLVSCLLSSVFCFCGFLVDLVFYFYENLRNKSGDK